MTWRPFDDETPLDQLIEVFKPGYDRAKLSIGYVWSVDNQSRCKMVYLQAEPDTSDRLEEAVELGLLWRPIGPLPDGWVQNNTFITRVPRETDDA